MDIDIWHLYLSFAVSLIGFGYFAYGRKQMDTPFVASGVALMVFSYFVPSLWLTGLIAGAICIAPFVFH